MSARQYLVHELRMQWLELCRIWRVYRAHRNRERIEAQLRGGWPRVVRVLVFGAAMLATWLFLMWLLPPVP